MIVLTGATGFIGSRVFNALVKNYEVACVYRESTSLNKIRNQGENCVWVKNEKKALENLFEKNHVSIIIHCATTFGRDNLDFFELYDSNINLPMELLKLANKYGVKSFINTDTFFVKNLIGKNLINDEVYMDDYTKSKYLLNEIVKRNISSWNFSYINLRLEHVYGKKDGDKKFVSFLFKCLKENKKVIELSQGKQIRDWIYIDDVVEAYLTIISNLGKFEAHKFYSYDVGTGVGTSVKEFCLLAKEICRSSSELRFGAIKMQNGEILRSIGMIDELLELGWKPRVTLDEGIRRILKDENDFDCYSNI